MIRWDPDASTELPNPGVAPAGGWISELPPRSEIERAPIRAADMIFKLRIPPSDIGQPRGISKAADLLIMV